MPILKKQAFRLAFCFFARGLENVGFYGIINIETLDKEELTMSFIEYCKIMEEHGIGDLCFLYNDKECNITMEYLEFTLQYTVEIGCDKYYFDDFDDVISTKYPSTGKDLKEMWNEIEILSIDGFVEDEYDTIDGFEEDEYYTKDCSFNYVQYLEEQGKLQYGYNHGAGKSFFMQLKYAILGILILPILSILIPLLGVGNWNVLILTGGLAVIAIIVAIIAMLRNRISIGYRITTKKIFIYYGVGFVTTYDNIKKVKLKKSIFKKGHGTVKIYVKKGISLNYRIKSVPKAEEVYNLIVKNIEKNRNQYNTPVVF